MNERVTGCHEVVPHICDIIIPTPTTMLVCRDYKINIDSACCRGYSHCWPKHQKLYPLPCMRAHTHTHISIYLVLVALQLPLSSPLSVHPTRWYLTCPWDHSPHNYCTTICGRGRWYKHTGLLPSLSLTHTHTAGIQPVCQPPLWPLWEHGATVYTLACQNTPC